MRDCSARTALSSLVMCRSIIRTLADAGSRAFASRAGAALSCCLSSAFSRISRPITSSASPSALLMASYSCSSTSCAVLLSRRWDSRLSIDPRSGFVLPTDTEAVLRDCTRGMRLRPRVLAPAENVSWDCFISKYRRRGARSQLQCTLMSATYSSVRILASRLRTLLAHGTRRELASHFSASRSEDEVGRLDAQLVLA